MKREKSMKAINPGINEVIEAGIKQIKAGMRTSPDPLLWEKVLAAGNDVDNGKTAVLAGSQSAGIFVFNYPVRPVLKIVWSALASAAAVIAGIIAADRFYSDSSIKEKDLYRQELSMQSAAQNNADNMLYQYYNNDEY